MMWSIVVFFWIVVAIVGLCNAPTFMVIVGLRRGTIDRVQRLNAYVDMVVYEVYFKNGKARVINIRFGSVLYNALKPYMQ